MGGEVDESRRRGLREGDQKQKNPYESVYLRF